MLKDTIDLNHVEKKSNFTGPLGTAELKLMKGPTRRQSKQSKKVEISNYYYQWQILKLSGKRKAKKNLTVFVKTPNWTAENDTSNDTIGMARLRGSARSK
jgi:hypothetical protein